MKPPPTLSELGALLPWAHFEVEAGEIVIYTGLELDDDEETTLWLSGVESPHWSPGRWVAWCVTHGSAAVKGRSGATWCEYVALRAMGECVWHPQGAFIPDDEGGTT